MSPILYLQDQLVIELTNFFGMMMMMMMRQCLWCYHAIATSSP